MQNKCLFLSILLIAVIILSSCENKTEVEENMSLVVNIYYNGQNGNAREFAEEMVSSGIVDKIRAEEGNERYEYFFPMDDEETVMLIDIWKDQESLDKHHASPMMNEIMKLREKYDLHMKVERFITAKEANTDQEFIRK